MTFPCSYSLSLHWLLIKFSLHFIFISPFFLSLTKFFLLHSIPIIVRTPFRIFRYESHISRLKVHQILYVRISPILLTKYDALSCFDGVFVLFLWNVLVIGYLTYWYVLVYTHNVFRDLFFCVVFDCYVCLFGRSIVRELSGFLHFPLFFFSGFLFHFYWNPWFLSPLKTLYLSVGEV